MRFLKPTISTTLLSFLLLPVTGYAEQTYQVELIGSYEKTDADTSTDKSTALFAEVFFSPVNTKNKPLAQAAFLDKSSSIGVGYIKQKLELQGTNPLTIDSTAPLVAINYITENSAFILGAAYSKLNLSAESNLLTADADNKLAIISIGKYLNDSSSLNFSYITSNEDLRIKGLGQPNQTISTDIKQYALEYNTVQALGDTNFYRFGTSFELIKKDSNSEKEDNREITVLGEYYFNQMTSLGISALVNSGDDVLKTGKIFGINATHFFTPHIALNASASKFLADDSEEEDTNSILVDVIARF